ncbi:ABC transporter ATP-binding protein [Neobacillus notoginsengisoli]|uniref:ABC transporter ATP-binding protein n=1 Tax=Neobacillus notoginsengisoli TaxID=1578198 RepID=A0A417YIJ8_9BACI|nr:ABC transporter ATP-binding protein [Neobacillus notoginsengisoli]RHW32849.1 ABC transporter ATP-binding protein [Neobacillus notoginsengisoli]
MKAKSVSLHNVSKSFGHHDGRPVYAVSDVTVKIEAGQFVTLLGPSGCGKTTTLRMIAGFEEISMGEIYFGDELVNNTPPNKRDCTMVFQSYALFPHLNVFDNISYGLKIKKLSKSEIHKKVEEVLTIMNLVEYKDRIPSQLSGGQQQRVALARALVMEPSVLLFDEPLSNLDAKLRVTMRDEIRRIQKKIGITAIYVTHDQSEAMSMSDQVIVMNKGHIEQIGTPQEIYQKPATKFVADFIGTANFIEGTVINISEDRLEIETTNGIIRAKNEGKHAINSPVLILVRPETIKLTKGTEAKALVTKSVFMGQTQEYEVEWNGQTLQISENNPAQEHIAQVGEYVSLQFSEQALHVI